MLKDSLITPHINAGFDEVASVVLFPGDPIRAQYIAEQFLDQFKLVNTVRNIWAYTGFYQNTKVTVFASGMGIGSANIYAYELYKFFHVQCIIRIGTCGATTASQLKIHDRIFAKTIITNSNYDEVVFNKASSTWSLPFEQEKLLNTVMQKTKQQLIPAKVLTNLAFYTCVENQTLSKDEFDVVEMEAYAIARLADYFKRRAYILLTVVDVIDADNEGIIKTQTGLDHFFVVQSALELAILETKRLKIQQKSSL